MTAKSNKGNLLEEAKSSKHSHNHGENVTGEEFPHTHLILITYLLTVPVVWLLDSFIFNFSTQLTAFVPFIIKLIASVIMIILSLIIMRSADNMLFKEERSDKIVINTGPFAYVRHPLYLSMLLLYLGLILFSFSIIALIYWGAFFVLFNKMVAFEEKDLIKILGPDYVEYMDKVARWIPYIF